MAFLGAYVWSIQRIFRRLVTVDLPPAAYYDVSIRLILSPFVALLFAYIPNIEGGVPVIAFFCGLFPQQALNYLRAKMPVFRSGTSDRAADLPLDMIEGISAFHQARLNEVGIDNAQNLATASLVELLVRTPFRPPALIDWIAQAKLYVAFKSDIVKLRTAGVRTALDLRLLGASETSLAVLAKATEIDHARLSSVYALIAKDASIEFLADAAARFAGV